MIENLTEATSERKSLLGVNPSSCSRNLRQLSCHVRCHEQWINSCNCPARFLHPLLSPGSPPQGGCHSQCAGLPVSITIITAIPHKHADCATPDLDNPSLRLCLASLDWVKLTRLGLTYHQVVVTATQSIFYSTHLFV